MDTLEKTELITSIRHIVKYLKSGKPIYNSIGPDTASRKTRSRRRKRGTQAIAKRYEFHANAKSKF